MIFIPPVSRSCFIFVASFWQYQDNVATGVQVKHHSQVGWITRWIWPWTHGRQL